MKKAANPGVLRAAEWARRVSDPNCTFPECTCPFVGEIGRPLGAQVRVLSLFSRDDPVVSPWASRVATGGNLEVSGTHGGLVYNAEVYRAIAGQLAGRYESVRPVTS
jgi:hypothetical protein